MVCSGAVWVRWTLRCSVRISYFFQPQTNQHCYSAYCCSTQPGTCQPSRHRGGSTVAAACWCRASCPSAPPPRRSVDQELVNVSEVGLHCWSFDLSKLGQSVSNKQTCRKFRSHIFPPRCWHSQFQVIQPLSWNSAS